MRLLTLVGCVAFAACGQPRQEISPPDPPVPEVQPDAAPPASGPDSPADRPVDAPSTAPPASSGSRPTSDTAPAPDEPWRALDRFDFAALPLADMPPDSGHISPIAAEGEVAEGSSAARLREIEATLTAWGPGHVAEPVQRVRNYLLIPAVADYAQSPLERFLPRIVLEHMLQEFPAEELAQLICWVALHPDDGEVTALRDPLLVGLGSAHLDEAEVRNRTYYYGVKLTRWIVGW